RTQNSGVRTSSANGPQSSLSTATTSAVKPITVTPARNAHRGVPARGPVSRVSVGSVIVNATPIRSLWEGTTITHFAEPSAYVPSHLLPGTHPPCVVTWSTPRIPRNFPPRARASHHPRAALVPREKTFRVVSAVRASNPFQGPSRPGC